MAPQPRMWRINDVWSQMYIDAMVLRDTYVNGVIQPAQRIYYQHDANFNTTAVVGLVGSTWQVTQRYIYTPYGMVTVLNADWTTAASQIPLTQYLHQGGRLDPITGLYLFRHRDYSPTLGNWIEQDPMGYVNGGSRYGYEAAVPVDGVDPAGEWASVRGYPVNMPGTFSATPMDTAKMIRVTIKCARTGCTAGAPSSQYEVPYLVETAGYLQRQHPKLSRRAAAAKSAARNLYERANAQAIAAAWDAGEKAAARKITGLTARNSALLKAKVRSLITTVWLATAAKKLRARAIYDRAQIKKKNPKDKHLPGVPTLRQLRSDLHSNLFIIFKSGK